MISHAMMMMLWEDASEEERAQMEASLAPYTPEGDVEREVARGLNGPYRIAGRGVSGHCLTHGEQDASWLEVHDASGYAAGHFDEDDTDNAKTLARRLNAAWHASKAA